MRYVVNTGSGVPNTSYIEMEKDGQTLQEVSAGSGPLDASFKAINRMLGMDLRLESFSLNAVTDGEDAVGEAVVETLRPIREEASRIMKDKAYLEQVYKAGAEKASYVAEKTLRKVYKKVGFVAK